MNVVDNLLYATSAEYKAHLEGLEHRMDYKGDWAFFIEKKEEAKAKYLDLIRTYGARTERSRSILQALAAEEKCGIIDNGNHAYLDNGIVQAKDCMPQEEDSDMACNVRKIYHYIDSNGEPATTQINAKSNAEADMKFQQMLTGGTPVKKDVPTLKQFVDNVYRPSFMDGLKKTTIQNYESYLHYNILPFMGDMRMDAITVATVQDFMNWMAEGKKHGRKKNINAKSIERTCGFAGRIFNLAVSLKVISDSPFKSKLLKNPGEAAGHHKALPDAEVARIKAEIPNLTDERERLYMALLVYTGMRREEVLGLRWEDVNLAEKYAQVHRGVTYPTMNHPEIDKPKTANSERTIPLVENVRVILQASQKAEGFIFGGESPLCYSTAKRLNKSAFDRLGIKGYSNHDFRTTLGTQLKESGMSSANVADVLGHGDTRMVETVYARPRHEGIMKQLDKLEMLNTTV